VLTPEIQRGKLDGWLLGHGAVYRRKSQSLTR
jgi:hypothetical protein